MLVIYHPQIRDQTNPDQQVEYAFQGDVIRATWDNQTAYYDVGQIMEGVEYRLEYPFFNARREDGEVIVELVKHIDPDAPQEEQFPDPFTPRDTIFEVGDIMPFYAHPTQAPDTFSLSPLDTFITDVTAIMANPDYQLTRESPIAKAWYTNVLTGLQSVEDVPDLANLKSLINQLLSELG